MIIEDCFLIKKVVWLANKLNISTDLQYKIYRRYYQAVNLLKRGDPFFFRIVCIEINTHCNRKCYYCPVCLEKEVPSYYMDEELFRLVIRRLKEIKFSGTIMYHFYNEPLLDKRLPEFVAYTRKHLPKCIIRILTNGDYLTLELADELIRAGVCDFAITDHNLQPGILSKKLQPVIVKYPNQININSIHDKPLSNRGGTIKVKKFDKNKGGNCTVISESLQIEYNGNILLCCNDYYRRFTFGNVINERIDEIWVKKDYVRLRRLLRKGVAELEICKKCNSIS